MMTVLVKPPSARSGTKQQQLGPAFTAAHAPQAGHQARLPTQCVERDGASDAAVAVQQFVW